MKIVIDIPEEMYTNGQLDKFFGCSSKKLDEVIYTGIPLPKGHGRLIDADAFSGDMFCDADLTNQHTCYDSIRKLLDDAPTIIEADGDIGE